MHGEAPGPQGGRVVLGGFVTGGVVERHGRSVVRVTPGTGGLHGGRVTVTVGGGEVGGGRGGGGGGGGGGGSVGFIDGGDGSGVAGGGGGGA